ncbi:hypothetical protein [Streptomyces longwoodensis]|uniref:hypothetical protein n=1 Tax=Streptomyces longwoodensis TaxID=68231 RepID=UPI0036F188EA
MTDKELHQFADIWREELLRDNPDVAREVRRMRRGMRSPSRIFLPEEGPGDVTGPVQSAG